MSGLPLVGDEFAGYRVRSVLGRGGMSVVYQAENLRLSSVIALKVLAPELATDDVFRARFLEESRMAASLNHPNVIPIYDMGSQDDLLYMVGEDPPQHRLQRLADEHEHAHVPGHVPVHEQGVPVRVHDQHGRMTPL